jgi:hypothetical protein
MPNQDNNSQNELAEEQSRNDADCNNCQGQHCPNCN